MTDAPVLPPPPPDKADDVSRVHSHCLHTLHEHHRALRDYVEWNANVVHQAWHREQSVGWRECGQSVCTQARQVLEQTAES